ncbi:serine/threonine-protein kinase [Labedella populi]|uniref:serine/threonine-protein kinase n=1 Tax=Labedella populi TaxID=2498850 RepID=UPI001AA06D12|nr:serine/threonine-protein kinase [Labedella populi]
MTDSLVRGRADIGDVLGGRYRLDALIGRGGMASVYRASDQTLGRDVAIKLFGDTSDDEAHSARAATEVRILASLNHSSLVTLFDAQLGTLEDAYLVMELVDGPTLRDRIASGPVNRDDIALMTAELAEALATVHTAGMVHRDVKPSNVLLAPAAPSSREFRAKLADFGIAHLVDSARLTTPGTIMGTAAYLSPEQTRGVAPAPAGDVYSLGLVILETFTRERAFPGGMTESLVARVQRDPYIPGDVGYGWKSLLTAMTSRTPENRPTAAQVADAARDLLGSSGPVASRAALGSVPPVTQSRAIGVPDENEQTAALAPVLSDHDDDDTTIGLRRRRRAELAARKPGTRRRLTIAAVAVLVAAGLGTGAASVLAGGDSPVVADDGTGIAGLRTVVGDFHSGIDAVITAEKQAAIETTEQETTEQETTVDTGNGGDTGADTGTDADAPVETAPEAPAPEAPAPEAPAPEAPAPEIPADSNPNKGAGNNNGGGNGGGNSSGSTDGKGNGNGNGNGNAGG